MQQASEVKARPPVILIGANENGLSVARSLAPSGVPVYSLGGVGWLRHSRYIECIEYDQPKTCTSDEQLQVWLNWLLSEGSRHFEGSVLIPCTDIAVEMIARNRGELRRSFLLDESEDEVSLALLDKLRTYEIARQIGIEAPRIWEVPNREALRSILCFWGVPTPRFSPFAIHALRLCSSARGSASGPGC